MSNLFIVVVFFTLYWTQWSHGLINSCPPGHFFRIHGTIDLMLLLLFIGPDNMITVSNNSDSIISKNARNDSFCLVSSDKHHFWLAVHDLNWNKIAGKTLPAAPGSKVRGMCCEGDTIAIRFVTIDDDDDVEDLVPTIVEQQIRTFRIKDGTIEEDRMRPHMRPTKIDSSKFFLDVASISTAVCNLEHGMIHFVCTMHIVFIQLENKERNIQTYWILLHVADQERDMDEGQVSIRSLFFHDQLCRQGSIVYCMRRWCYKQLHNADIQCITF